MGEDGGLCQRPPVLEWKKPICLLGANHTFWLGVVEELREEMKSYISFTDEDIFSGMALPEESHKTQPKEATLEITNPTQANLPLRRPLQW